MLYTINQAVALYRFNRDDFRVVQHRGMTDDFSWGTSARAYRDIYVSIMGE